MRSYVGSDFASHVEWLREEHGAHGHVARVGVKGVGDGVSQRVALFGQLRQIGPDALHECCQVRVLRHNLLRHVAQLRGRGSAHVVERVDLPVAEQLHLPSAAHVAGSERHLGQVVGAGRLRFGLGAPHLFGPDGQLQVGAFGHQHARVERERALCPRCQRKAREHNGK